MSTLGTESEKIVLTMPFACVNEFLPLHCQYHEVLIPPFHPLTLMNENFHHEGIL